MRLYLDACCICRPFDDQSRQSIRMEAEAIRIVLDLCRRGMHRWVSSEAVEDELRRDQNIARCEATLRLLAFADEHAPLSNTAFDSALASPLTASGRWTRCSPLTQGSGPPWPGIPGASL